MTDIARDLRVSVVTVSKALRNDAKISLATRKRVLRRAKQLGYQTNWVARSLATKRTYTIGLLLPDFTHPFFAEIAKAVADTVRAHDYRVIISYFEEDPEWESRETDSLFGPAGGWADHRLGPISRPARYVRAHSATECSLCLDRPADRRAPCFLCWGGQ